MSVRYLTTLENEDLSRRDTSEIFLACAADTDNELIWHELMHRIVPRICQFIRGALRQSVGDAFTSAKDDKSVAGIQEKDLLQSTILRLVENDCAVMRRFSGTKDSELYAYLAIIARSVVRDCLRRLRAQKRPVSAEIATPNSASVIPEFRSESPDPRPDFEKQVLMRELSVLAGRVLCRFSARDRLIFELYFSHGLSFSQISQCKGVRLSKAGVEKAVARMKERVRSEALNGRSEAIFQ